MSNISLKSIFATLPRTVRGEKIVLNGDPKGKNFLYVNGNSVIIRNIENPEIAEIYTEHSSITTCAQYSPSGFYIASADVLGKVRIWDTVNKEHILKNEFQPFSGPVKDLCWSSDNSKIAVAGEGREKFAHVFLADTGTSVGTIMGHSKCINSISLKPTRPFRLATASDDMSVAFFDGPPFKFVHSQKDHTRFVNCVRYSPDGSIFISGGADGKLIIYDGKDGKKTNELGNPAHKGGIYGLSFSEDSKQILTVSGDKTAKIWDLETASVVTEFNMGSTVQDMQVGCLWQGSHLLTVSLSGHINYLDRNNPDKPLRIIKGHNLPITSLTVSEDKNTIFTSDSEGSICYWSTGGENNLFVGNKHGSQIQKLNVVNDKLISCSMDDTVAFSNISSKEYGQRISLASQPRDSTSVGNVTAIACVDSIVLLQNESPVHKLPVDYEPTSIALNKSQTELAVGGKDSKIRIYQLDSNLKIDEKKVLPIRGTASSLSYSPDENFLAATSTDRPIYCFKLPEYEEFTSSKWVYHTARVQTAAWSDNGQKLLSGGIDTSAFIWDPNNVNTKIELKGYHPMAFVSGVGWLNENTIVTAASDSCVRIFNIN